MDQPQTQLTISLSTEIMEIVRRKVSAGEYRSEADCIESVLVAELLLEPVQEDELTHWANTEGVRRLQAMESDPGSALTEEEVFDFLDEKPGVSEAA